MVVDHLGLNPILMVFFLVRFQIYHDFELLEIGINRKKVLWHIEKRSSNK